MLEILNQQGINQENVPLIGTICGGSVGRALEISASHFLDLRHQVIELLADSQSIGIRGNLELSAEISKDRDVALDSIEIALSWVRDLLVVKEGFQISSYQLGFA